MSGQLKNKSLAEITGKPSKEQKYDALVGF